MSSAPQTTSEAVSAPVGTPVEVASRPAPLDLSGVVKRWRRTVTPVLDDVSLSLPPGSLTWISGRNGAGKTTLLRIAAGVISPDAGTVRVCGLDPDAERKQFHRHVGFLSTGTSGLYARLTVRQHLDYQSKLDLMPLPQARVAVEREYQRFDLAVLDGRRVDRLSMGQRQRLRLAMVMLHHPKVLLLDEPRNSLDAEGVEILHGAVSEVLHAGGAVVWSSPTGDPPDMATDRSFVINAGRLEPK